VYSVIFVFTKLLKIIRNSNMSENKITLHIEYNICYIYSQTVSS